MDLDERDRLIVESRIEFAQEEVRYGDEIMDIFKRDSDVSMRPALEEAKRRHEERQQAINDAYVARGKATGTEINWLMVRELPELLLDYHLKREDERHAAEVKGINPPPPPDDEGLLFLSAQHTYIQTRIYKRYAEIRRRTQSPAWQARFEQYMNALGVLSNELGQAVQRFEAIAQSEAEYERQRAEIERQYADLWEEVGA